MLSAVSLVTPALAADRYVVKGARPVSRTTSLVSERDLAATKLNSEYDNLAIQVQEAARLISQALRRSDLGKISVGMRADIAEIMAPSYIHLAYRPGAPLIGRVWKDGELISG